MGREITPLENEELLWQKEDTNDLPNKPLKKIQLNHSFVKIKMSAPGKDHLGKVFS